MTLSCKLVAVSDVEHLQQIYTGLSQLAHDGRIKLNQAVVTLKNPEILARGKWTDYRYFNTFLEIDGRIKIVFDLHDWSYIDPEILAECDVYFKRSFDEAYVNGLSGGGKVFRLGLNFPVTSDRFDRFRVGRSSFYRGKERAAFLLKALSLDRFLHRREAEKLQNLHSGPNVGLEPKILFMARLWDPGRLESRQQKQAVEELNASRAECVLRMRREFGDRFFGGVSHDDYSKKYFPEALLVDPDASVKRNYLQILKNYPICVATVGLNGSNGWKLAEYVANSKAILTEPLRYSVPGEFLDGSNFMTFASPDEMVSKAQHLIDNDELRIGMMQNNYRYYNEFVRPDSMVRYAIKTALRYTGSSNTLCSS